MTQRLRFLEAGEIARGDRLWQFAAPEQIPFGRNCAEKSEVARLLREPGAVCFEIDANYDEEDHEAEDEFGWGMTYGEYWELHPEQKPPKPVPCWQTWILLSVSAPFMRLRSPTVDRTLIAEWDAVQWNDDWESGDYQFYLALTLATPSDLENDTRGSDTPQPVVIKLSQLSPLPGDRPATMSGREWQMGEGMTLQPLAYDHVAQPGQSQRDWDWTWREHPSLGPIYLRIFVDKTAAELKAWFEWIVTTRLSTNEFYPCLYSKPSQIANDLRLYFSDLAITELPTDDFYRCFDDLLTQRRGRLPQVYHPSGHYSYVANPGDYPTGWQLLCDGLFELSRNYHTPDLDQQSIDAILLSAILAGELGEISWDLLDGDYVYFEATGDGLASLQTYLNPHNNPDQLRQEWSRRLADHPVDASTANNAQEAAVKIAQQFQVPMIGSDAIANLETWLGTTPIAQLPRRVTVKLPRRLGSTYDTDPGYPRIIAANSRILWRWSFDG